jgi:RNA polymerase sigma factor (sigma-70 family)
MAGEGMSIFNSEKVDELVSSYKETGDEDVLLEILEECRPLMEFIAKGCNPVDMEDMIQDARIKLVKSLKSYDPSKSNTHTYFARVIKNSCITHFHRDNRGAGDCDLDDETEDPRQTSPEISDTFLSDSILRNRLRFPSLDTDVIDGITELIYHSICDGLDKGRTTVRLISKEFNVTREQAITIYSSTLIYFRMKFEGHKVLDVSIDEFSLSPEMLEILGKDAYAKIVNTFSGVIIHM